MDRSLNTSNVAKKRKKKKKCREDIDESVEPNINHFLCDDLLAIIFGKLDLKSRLMAERVCTLWRQHITRMFDVKTELVIDWAQELKESVHEECGPVLPKDIEYIVLSDFVPQTAPKKAKLEAIAQIVAKYGRIETLTATTKGLNSDVIKSLCLRPNEYIKRFSIINRDDSHLRITCPEIQLLAQNYPNLTDLSIDTSEDVVISESAVELLLKGLPALEEFVLPASVKSQYTGNVFKHMNAGIQYINTTGNLLNVFAICRLAAKGVDQLRELIVTRLDPDCIIAIAHFFTSLRALSLDLWIKPTTAFWLKSPFELIARLIHLEVLSLSFPMDCRSRISNAAIDALKKCPKLRSLTLTEVWVDHHFLSAVADNMPGLRELSLHDVFFENTENMIESLEPIQRLKHLRSLSLRGNKNLNDNHFEWFIASFPQITQIDVSFAENLTIDSMMSCVEVCRQQPNRWLTAVFSADLIPVNGLSLTIPENLDLKWSFY